MLHSPLNMKRLRQMFLPAAAWLTWAVSMFWLIRFEAFPHLFDRVLPGYRVLERSTPIVGDWWMKILLDSEPAGYSHTTLDFNEHDPEQHYKIRNESLLALNVMGEVQHIRTTAEVALDMLYQVQQFIFHYASGPYSLRILGRRMSPQAFRLRLISPAGEYQKQVSLPEGTIISDLMPESGLVKLRPGQELSLRTFNPVTLSSSIVKIRALRYENVAFQDRTVRALVVEVNYEGMRTVSWLDDEGRLIRQETPFGLQLVACTPEEAAAYAQRPTSDIMGKLGIPTEGDVSCPRQAQSLTLEISGLALDPTELPSSRQQVLRTQAEALILQVERERALPAESPPATLPAEVSRYLEPGPFIQSDAPEIQQTARQITAGQSDAAARAKAICDWVYTHMDKTPASGVPSAVDILHTLQGDCNEHTYLFVALARAAGIPARVLLGLAYAENGFYYHAWPAVYLDRWYEMDPTFGQHAVDATHIALTEGEGPPQLKLLAVIGQIRLKVEQCVCD